MGQKSNLISLINPTGSLNLINLNSKVFLRNFLFIKSLEIFLIKKNIVLLDSKFIFFNNTCFIHLFVFLMRKVIFYKLKRPDWNLFTIGKFRFYLFKDVMLKELLKVLFFKISICFNCYLSKYILTISIEPAFL